MLAKSLRDRPVRALVVLLGILTLAGSELSAQRGHSRYGVVLTHALSVRSPAHFVEAVRPGSVVFSASLPVSSRRWWRLEYSFDLIPLAWVRRSVVGDPPLRECDTSFGFGVRPAGLRMVLGRPRVSVEAAISGAVVRYNRPTPALDAAKTNFIGSVSVGLRVQALGVDLGGGYRRTHISNGDRADYNPGIDSAEVYIGVWFH